MRFLRYLPNVDALVFQRKFIPEDMAADELDREALLGAINFKPKVWSKMSASAYLDQNISRFLKPLRAYQSSKRYKFMIEEIYYNFLKGMHGRSSILGKWEKQFELTSLFIRDIAAFLHPVLYVGAQFELWKSHELPFPLPSHIIPHRSACIRALQFKILVLEKYKDFPEQIDLYIENYLSENPYRLYLIKKI